MEETMPFEETKLAETFSEEVSFAESQREEETSEEWDAKESESEQQVIQEQATQEQATQEQATQEQATQEQATQEQVTQELTTQEQTTGETTENNENSVHPPKPPLEESDSRWTITQYADDSGNQGLFYTLYQKSTGKFIVIDGGWSQNAGQVRNVIKAHGNVVNAWFLTHYHNDHIGAFNEIYKNPGDIRIEQIFDSPIGYDRYLAVAQTWDMPEYLEEYQKYTKEATNVQHLSRGEVLSFGDLNCQVLNAYDSYIDSRGDIPNKLSLMLRFSGKEKSFLFCGDCYDEDLSNYLIGQYGDGLKSTFVQLGHHGNHSMTTEFYEKVSPTEVFFDAPLWLMTGEQFNAKDYKDYFTGKGITVHDYSQTPNVIRIY